MLVAWADQADMHSLPHSVPGAVWPEQVTATACSMKQKHHARCGNVDVRHLLALLHLPNTVLRHIPNVAMERTLQKPAQRIGRSFHETMSSSSRLYHTQAGSTASYHVGVSLKTPCKHHGLGNGGMSPSRQHLDDEILQEAVCHEIAAAIWSL